MPRLVTLEAVDLPIIDTSNLTARAVDLGPVPISVQQASFEVVMAAMEYLKSKTGLRTGTPIGFSLAHEGFGYSVCSQFRGKRWLSEKQFSAVQRLIWTYRRQLKNDAGMDPEALVALKYPNIDEDGAPQTSAFKIKARLVSSTDRAVRVRFLEPTKYGNEPVFLPRKNVVKDTLNSLLNEGTTDIYVVGWLAQKLGLK